MHVVTQQSWVGSVCSFTKCWLNFPICLKFPPRKCTADTNSNSKLQSRISQSCRVVTNPNPPVLELWLVTNSAHASRYERKVNHVGVAATSIYGTTLDGLWILPRPSHLTAKSSSLFSSRENMQVITFGSLHELIAPQKVEHWCSERSPTKPNRLRRLQLHEGSGKADATLNRLRSVGEDSNCFESWDAFDNKGVILPAEYDCNEKGNVDDTDCDCINASVSHSQGEVSRSP